MTNKPSCDPSKLICPALSAAEAEIMQLDFALGVITSLEHSDGVEVARSIARNALTRAPLVGRLSAEEADKVFQDNVAWYRGLETKITKPETRGQKIKRLFAAYF